MSTLKKCIAEFIGTFVLVLFGCGTAVVVGAKMSGELSTAGYLTTALAFGLVIVAMAYSIGNVSGCHINPAVSIAMLIVKKLSVKDFAAYVIAQVLGAIAGSAVLFALVGKENGLGENGLYNGSIGLSFLVEVILTCVFVLAVLGATAKKENGPAAGLVIGGALTLVHILGIYFTGTSVNPARSLAPAIFVGGDALSCVWVFILAPLCGGILAAIIAKATKLHE